MRAKCAASGQDDEKKSYLHLLPRHMVDDWGEVGRSIELNWLQTLVVNFHNTIDTCTVWILRIPILCRQDKQHSWFSQFSVWISALPVMVSSLFLSYQGKLMWDPSIRWQLGSKAQSGKHFITIIVLDDFSNCLQGHSIGIQLVGAHVMKGSGLGWVTWTEVNLLSLNYCL